MNNAMQSRGTQAGILAAAVVAITIFVLENVNENWLGEADSMMLIPTCHAALTVILRQLWPGLRTQPPVEPTLSRNGYLRYSEDTATTTHADDGVAG